MCSLPSTWMPENTGLAAHGIFGGTFDPVHLGHLRLAEEAADSLGLHCVRWIPAGQPVLREPPLGSAEQRLEMVRLAIAGNPRFALDTAEAESAQPSYTVPTLERLRRPDHYGAQRPLVLLVGADAFTHMARWHRWESLFDLAHVAVAHRPGFPVDAASLPPPVAAVFRQRHCVSPTALNEEPAGRVFMFAMTPLAISSTRIRKLLSQGLSPRYLLPEAVIAYIQSTSLYTSS